jgi:signal transduction histidine kinase
MSHELRTPLNVMLGFAQLLEDAPLANPTDRRSVAQILEAGGRLLDLVDRVLEFTQGDDQAPGGDDRLLDANRPGAVDRVLDLVDGPTTAPNARVVG